MQHNEITFVHLCNAAASGENWALERIQPALLEWFFTGSDAVIMLELIRSADCTRPDRVIDRAGIEV